MSSETAAQAGGIPVIHGRGRPTTGCDQCRRRVSQGISWDQLTKGGNDAKDVVLSDDPHKAAQLDDDDAMHDLHRQLFTVLMDSEWKHGVAAAVDVTLLGRFYERFADHAVEIGRRITFQATGSITTDTAAVNARVARS